MAIAFPTSVRLLLHDCDPAALTWDRHRDFLIDRILADGEWEAIGWLRGAVGDEAVRARILASRGARLSPRQLRFWQVVLDLPDDDVTRWINDPSRAIWDRRVW